MKKADYFEMSFQSAESNRGLASAAIAAFVRRMNLDAVTMVDIRTSVEEAVSNCIVHAYPDKLGVISIKAKILKDKTLEVIIKDHGIGIENPPKMMEPTATTGGAEFAGMGFTIMKSFMDSIDVRSVPGKGTVVKLKKRLYPHG